MFFSLLFGACSKSDITPIIEKPKPVAVDSIDVATLKFPKKEMRAAWVATVWELDWPKVRGEAAQKQKYIEILDKLKELKFNTVFFQVKGMGDAYYDSPYEPWSASISGTRGVSPGYDILKFLIDEAHARGIEFHAWINPYRISTRLNKESAYPTLHSSIPASWVVDHEKIRIYNPALPEVRIRLANIVKDLIAKYDIDGLHMDDYFYPDPSAAGIMVSDDLDFNTLKGDFTDKDTWRRNNVDQAIELIFNAIKLNKPELVFSISPAASRSYNYNTLFADLPKWTSSGWLDLLIPQLYQEVGNSYNPFERNLKDWTAVKGLSKVVIGHGYYKFGDPTAAVAFQNANELSRQFELVRSNENTVGSAMYSVRDILSNRIGITDRLKELYSNQVVMPFVGREVATKPIAPTNIKLNGSDMSWSITSDKLRTVVYYFSSLSAQGRVVAITKEKSIKINNYGYYCLTSLNEDNLESLPTSTVEKK